MEISHQIADNLDVAKILHRSAKTWDGGYTICGILGHAMLIIVIPLVSVLLFIIAAMKSR